MSRREATKAETRDAFLDAAALVDAMFGNLDDVPFILDHGDTRGMAMMLALYIQCSMGEYADHGKAAEWLRGVACCGQ